MDHLISVFLLFSFFCRRILPSMSSLLCLTHHLSTTSCHLWNVCVSMCLCASFCTCIPCCCSCCSVPKPRPISFSGLSTLIRRSSMQQDTTIVVGSVCVGSCGCPLKWTSQQIASLPLSVGGLGLHSAVLVRHAYWSSWADCVHMVNKRHPQICRSILRSIATDNPLHHIEGVSISEAALRLSGFHPPSWEERAEGLRPGRRAIEDEDRTQPRFGWQKLAAESLQLNFRENVLMPSLPVEKRVLLRSQSGPFSSTPFVAFPTTKATTFDPQPFRVLILRPTFPSLCPLATAGVAVLSTALATTVQLAQWQGFLGEGGSHLRVQPRVCTGRQAPVRTNVMVRDLDLWPPHRIDNSRLEVVADGLPLHGRAQLAIDTTLVSALTRDGTARPGADRHDGVALAEARRRKERTYPELSGEGGRARLVVLAAEVGGRWSDEARTFLGVTCKGQNQVCTSPVAAQSGQHGFTGGDVSLNALLLAVSPCPCSTLSAPGVDGDVPSMQDVLSEGRYFL